MINGIRVDALKIFQVAEGDVMHALKEEEDSFIRFGEAYFSNIKYKSIKAWKRHTQMTLNLVVPVGEIKFVFYDDRNFSSGEFYEITLSKKNYCRITVPPMIWMGFQGLSEETSTLLNIADISHDPLEVERLPFEKIKYNWL